MLSPLVRGLATEVGLDVNAITGTGAGGRIRREDVERAIATKGAPAAAGGPTPTAPAAPAAAPVAGGVAGPPAGRPGAQPAPQLGPRDEAVPLPRIRLAIAERMTQSVRIAPHVWTSVEVDLDNVERVRQKHKERFRREEGMALRVAFCITM
jgi:2-oxoglutarate dehydrogenase E2 component (dihydrolipoamide succinyltransferase)